MPKVFGKPGTKSFRGRVRAQFTRIKQLLNDTLVQNQKQPAAKQWYSGADVNVLTLAVGIMTAKLNAVN
jgi:hypothetical protein